MTKLFFQIWIGRDVEKRRLGTSNYLRVYSLDVSISPQALTRRRVNRVACNSVSCLRNVKTCEGALINSIKTLSPLSLATRSSHHRHRDSPPSIRHLRFPRLAVGKHHRRDFRERQSNRYPRSIASRLIRLTR